MAVKRNNSLTKCGEKHCSRNLPDWIDIGWTRNDINIPIPPHVYPHGLLPANNVNDKAYDKGNEAPDSRIYREKTLNLPPIRGGGVMGPGEEILSLKNQTFRTMKNRAVRKACDCTRETLKDDGNDYG